MMRILSVLLLIAGLLAAGIGGAALLEEFAPKEMVVESGLPAPEAEAAAEPVAEAPVEIAAPEPAAEAAPEAIGVPESGMRVAPPTITTPCLAKASLTSGSCMIALSSALNFCTMSSGRPAGAMMPYQVSTIRLG